MSPLTHFSCQELLQEILRGSTINLNQPHVLTASCFHTPLGPMIAIADATSLYLLEFIERRKLPHQIATLQKIINAQIITGITPVLSGIERELAHYFAGTLTKFTTPVAPLGSPFQKSIWEELRKIPYGQTCSYLSLAHAVDNPRGCRAVAQANGANRLAIIIPCHRVINSTGALGGYAGGLTRKITLLEIEKNAHPFS